MAYQERRGLLDKTQNSLKSVSGYEDNMSTGFGSDDAQLDAFMAFRNTVDYSQGSNAEKPRSSCSASSFFGALCPLLLELVAVCVLSVVAVSNSPLALALASLSLSGLGRLLTRGAQQAPLAGQVEAPSLVMDDFVLQSPELTLAMAFLGKISLSKAALHALFQLLGALLGALLVQSMGALVAPAASAEDSCAEPARLTLEAFTSASTVFLTALAVAEAEMRLLVSQDALEHRTVRDLTVSASYSLGVFIKASSLRFAHSAFALPAVATALSLVGGHFDGPPLYLHWGSALGGALCGYLVTSLATVDYKDERRGLLRSIASVAPVCVEFVGTGLVAFFFVAAKGPEVLFAAVVALQMSCFRKSGAHFNPVLTISYVSLKGNSWKVGGVYVVMQLAGAVVGAATASAVAAQCPAAPAVDAAEGVAGLAVTGACEVFGSLALAAFFCNNLMMDSPTRGPVDTVALGALSVAGVAGLKGVPTFFASPAIAVANAVRNMQPSAEDACRVLLPLIVAAAVPRFYKRKSAAYDSIIGI